MSAEHEPPREYCRYSGKIIYASKSAASGANHRIRDRYGDVHPYHCPNCGKWHLGRGGPRR